MIPALIKFVRVLGGEGGALAVGLPVGPSMDGITAIDEDGARALAAAARTDQLDDPAELPARLGIDPDDLAARTVVVMAGRDAGWQFPDLLELLPHLARAAARVIVVARPNSLASTPAALHAILARTGHPPLLAGITPPSDEIAPGCPIAVIERTVDPDPVTLGAIVTAGDDIEAARHTLRQLAAQGVSSVVVDAGASGAADALADFDGVALALAADADFDEAAAARAQGVFGATWLLDLDAGDRLRSPLQDRPLADFLALAGALGFNAVQATIAEIGPPLDSHEPGLGYWRFALNPSDFGRVVARRTGADIGDRRVSPYNLILERPAPHLSPGARGVTREPLALMEERGAGLIERLTGHGIFDMAYPVPAGLRWLVEETIVSWHSNVLKAGVGRLPYPDPLAPLPGACLIRWDTIDALPASLTVQRGDGPERFVARGGSGTVTIDGLRPGVTETVRLTADQPRGLVLGELRLRFEFEPAD